MIKKYFKKSKEHFKQVLEIKDSPKSIAAGFAIGTAIAILPTFGLGFLIGLLVLLIFKKISKISLFSAFIVWNPLILYPMITLEYSIGNFLLKDLPMVVYRWEILNEIITYSRRYLLGSLITTIFFSLLSYIIIYFLAKRYQKQYREKIKKPIENLLELNLENKK